MHPLTCVKYGASARPARCIASLSLCSVIDSIIIVNYIKGLETAHVRPLKRVANSTGNPRYELSQFRAPEKERTLKIK